MNEKDYLISASILSADYTTLGDQLNQAKAAGADWFHIDIIKASAEYNETVAVFNDEFRAKRPIIEFKSNLQMFNHGNVPYITQTPASEPAKVELERLQ